MTNLNTIFTPAQIKKLEKENLTPDNLISLYSFYQQFKDVHCEALIIKNFINYKDNIDRITALEFELREAGIVNHMTCYTVASLNALQALILTSQDFENFRAIWKQTRNRNLLFTMIAFKKLVI